MAITKIAQVDVGAGGATSIDFTGIPNIYTDLLVAYSVRGTNASQAIDLWTRLNNSTTTVYSERMIYGNGSAAQSASSASGVAGQINWGLGDAANSDTNVFSNGQVYIPNYASTTASKSLSLDSVSENNIQAALSYVTGGLWASNSAITQVTLIASTGTLVQYSSASLYGISKTGATGATVA